MTKLCVLFYFLVYEDFEMRLKIVNSVNEKLLKCTTFRYSAERNNGIGLWAVTADDREVRNLFMRTNMLVRRFINCSHKVKIILLRSYCVCLYDCCLWSNYTDGCLSKLKLCYHKCIKMFFFGFKRSDSVTQILLQLGSPSCNTLIHNSRAIFLRTWTNCPNMLVSHLRQLGLCF